MSATSPPLAARFLERALLFTLAAHLAAMLTMALLLLPGVPGGGNEAAASRAAYIAANPWWWRLGWLPWQITALSDLLLGFALVTTRWIPKLPALLALGLTLIAIAFEQPGEFRWITEGVTLAQSVVAAGEVRPFEDFEAQVFPRVSLWAAGFYTLAAIAWSWAFAGAGTWNWLLTVLSAATWTILAIVSFGPLLLGEAWIGPTLIALGNAIGFVLMMTWFVLVTEAVLRRSRLTERYGRMAQWRYPRPGLVSSLLNLLANARLPRAIGELLPTPAFVSDITDVVYVNYFCPAERLLPLVPAGLELQRLGPDGQWALFTFLTFRHGHFGPRFFGPLRRLLPSPIQSNWRIHVRDPRTGALGIYFVSTAISNVLNAVAARHLSEGMPMHVPGAAELARADDGALRLRLDAGSGSAPEFTAELRPVTDSFPSDCWQGCFASFHEFLAYCVPQDRALSTQPWLERTTRQEIHLGIPLEACEPLAGQVESTSAAALVGPAAPICFRVPKVRFQFVGEVYDPW